MENSQIVMYNELTILVAEFDIEFATFLVGIGKEAGKSDFKG